MTANTSTSPATSDTIDLKYACDSIIEQLHFAAQAIDTACVMLGELCQQGHDSRAAPAFVDDCSVHGGAVSDEEQALYGVAS